MVALAPVPMRRGTNKAARRSGDLAAQMTADLWPPKGTCTPIVYTLAPNLKYQGQSIYNMSTWTLEVLSTEGVPYLLAAFRM